MGFTGSLHRTPRRTTLEHYLIDKLTCSTFTKCKTIQKHSSLIWHTYTEELKEIFDANLQCYYVVLY